jgi:hypothetical protein
MSKEHHIVIQQKLWLTINVNYKNRLFITGKYISAFSLKFGTHHFQQIMNVPHNNFLLFSPGSAEHGKTRPIQSEASGQRIPGRENAQVQILAKKRRYLQSALMKKKISLIN